MSFLGPHPRHLLFVTVITIGQNRQSSSAATACAVIHKYSLLCRLGINLISVDYLLLGNNPLQQWIKTCLKWITTY